MAAAPMATVLPSVTPAKRPLRFPANLIKLLSNNIGIVPEQAYEEEVVLAAGPPRMAFITGAEAVETVLKKQASQFPKGRLQNEVLEPLFGDAMISSEGAEWRWQRGIAAPLFRHEELLRYVPIMQGAADHTISVWRKAGDGEHRAIDRDMMHAAFSVISQTMLVGGANDVITAIETGHAKYFRQVNWWVLYRMLCLPHWLPRPGGRAMRIQEQKLRDAVRALVHERLEGTAGADDLLGRLLSAEAPNTGRRMPEERLVNNIIAFLVAGYDTTALALSWTLYLIAQSSEWEEKIRVEVERVAGDAPLGAKELNQLVVVEQVLNEALRLYPTAPIIVRDINEDVEIAGVHVPAGTIGIVPIYAIHRHRSFWRNPETFDPARFAPDAPEKPSRYQYLPFGAGPRICIGAAFSVMEAKIMLANFVRAAKFELRPGFAPQPTGQMFLTAGDSIPMRVHLRR